jgi:hypothetical protein
MIYEPVQVYEGDGLEHHFPDGFYSVYLNEDMYFPSRCKLVSLKLKEKKFDLLFTSILLLEKTNTNAIRNIRILNVGKFLLCSIGDRGYASQEEYGELVDYRNPAFYKVSFSFDKFMER